MRFARTGGVVVCLLVSGYLVASGSLASAQQTRPAIPHAQDKPPNDPRDPATAAKMMTVPDGFAVEVVAAEPDLVNPVAMAIDEKGRFWVTESLEYPRREPGPGKDRVKILEDTDGDGVCDKFTVFLDGLNIPSGIAVGYGGAWVANSPDILFVQDTDGDGKADKQEVIVTGFGRTDTHELPNSLTWGPDGWLYGLNGVFNHSHVKYSQANPNFREGHPGWPITCALFRIHPRTREFQVFCEGTSNPWGVAINSEGDAFVSACVIDHLWHLVETGYYHRQGGPYPPFTWKIESIVKHKHQKAAYCGIHYFDSDAYPEKFRDKLYMGNIHGGCINVDRVEREGSTYKGTGEPDFLTANDAWFMPVVQKTGPDGSLYILDWYDRYHCYQDANRDPAGIDRLKGRLYRVRYKDTPRVPKEFDLAKASDQELIGNLGARNDFVYSTAQRLLVERNSEEIGNQLLSRLALSASGDFSREQRRRMFWTLGSMTVSSSQKTREWVAEEPDPVISAWAIRFLGNGPKPSLAAELERLHARLLNQKDASERLQIIIAASKFVRNQPENLRTQTEIGAYFKILLRALAVTDNDPLIPRVIWQNLHPWLETHADSFVSLLEDPALPGNASLMSLMPRIIDRLLSRQVNDAKTVAALFSISRANPLVCREVLAVLAAKAQSGELRGEKLESLKREVVPQLKEVFAGKTDSPIYLNAVFFATALGDPSGYTAATRAVETVAIGEDQRLAAVNSLIAARQDGVLVSVEKILQRTPPESVDFRGKLLTSLARLDNPEVASMTLRLYSKMEPELQPKAIELLTQRANWARQLLTSIGEKKIPATAINLNQARRLKDLKDSELSGLLLKHWGQVREGRDPNREQYIASMKSLIRKTPGDPLAGEKAFKKVCAQCHKLYGEGAEVGPDITRNGRNDFAQLLSNVFDPSLVIGAGYRSYTVVTDGGRVLNGLLAEDSPQRIVLKVQGGKQEVIPRAEIDEFKVSEVSLMPEQLEKQLSQQEIVDLFAFITLDKHPSDSTAKQLPGVKQVAFRETTNPAEFPALIGEVLPGFATSESGELGVGLLPEFRGHDNVIRTHPVTRDKPCILSTMLIPPKDKKTTLILDVSHDPRGDWRLVIRGNGQRMADEMISKETTSNGWRTINVDLSKFAGQELKLDLVNQANDWSWEFGYWGSARIIVE